MKIDWTDPTCPVSSYFTVKEAVWLPKWGRLASHGDGLDTEACNALVMLFQRMDQVREFLDRPIHVHVAYRPRPYNLEVGGVPESCHMARRENGALVAAVDWDARIDEDFMGESCDDVRSLILPKLDEWNLRCEDNGPGSPWLHLDTRIPLPGHSRFFRP